MVRGKRGVKLVDHTNAVDGNGRAVGDHNVIQCVVVGSAGLLGRIVNARFLIIERF